MTGRTAREILSDRERELKSELASLIEYKEAIERELEDVRRAIETLGPQKSSVSDRSKISDSITAVFIPAEEALKQHNSMTINELVLDALAVHFPDGASHAMFRDVFRELYGRTIEQSSLRSQLARLKAMGLVKEAAQKGVVELTPQGAGQAQNERRQRMLRFQSRS